MSVDTKELLGMEIAKRLKDGDLVGVGTGTTVAAALRAFQERIAQENLRIKIAPTSYQTAWQCEEFGLELLPEDYSGRLTWGFDGADEVDKDRRAIKGRGGAFRKEKEIAELCDEYVLIITEDKVSQRLGALSPVPVEFIASKKKTVEQALLSLGAGDVTLRIAEFVGRSGPYFTDSGNLVFDATFSEISDQLEAELNAIDGVIDNGIFTRQTTSVLIASETGITSL